MSIIQLTISIGQIFGLVVGFFTLDGLDSGNWRALILITSVPGIIAWFFAYYYLGF